MTDREHHDLNLVSRMLGGEDSAFDTFIDEYYPRLYRFAYPRVGKNTDAAQEVVQGTFEKVIPKLGLYRGEAALFSWLCSFCRFEISSHWKNHYRREPEVELVEDSPAVSAALESIAMIEDGPAGQLEKKELARLVRVILDNLPLRYGKALELKYLKGQPVRQIAEHLEISPKAAESLLTRARQAFRDGFAELVGGWRT